MMDVLMLRLRTFLAAVVAVVFVVGFSARAAGGAFDYYVLSLSWAPEFCEQPGVAASHPHECAAGRHIGFVVHGLWPRLNGGTLGANPESCGPAKSVSKGIVNSLTGAMPDSELVQRDWALHGSCTGLAMNEYFTTLLLARAAVQIPVQISSITEGIQETPSQVEGQFAEANPSFPKGAFRAVCEGGALTEVRACFDKDLKARVCAVGAAGSCAETAFRVRPPR